MSTLRESGSLSRMIAEFEARPGQVATVTLSDLRADILIRREVRAALDLARVRGAEVDAHEQRGWLDSAFAVRMRGTDEQLLPTLYALDGLT